MLFRRISAHVNQQNWFAVGIDFVIVVVGVYIGIQVSNWNDATRVRSLEQTYLSRLAGELEANIQGFEDDLRFASQSQNSISAFVSALRETQTTDADLIFKTSEFMSVGVVFSDFRPNRTTFDEMVSTGNLGIIHDPALREALRTLYAGYADGVDTFQVNRDWALQIEGEIYTRLDVLRFSDVTSTTFPTQPDSESADYIRKNSALLNRYAALHYWLKTSSTRVLDYSASRSLAVLRQLEAYH